MKRILHISKFYHPYYGGIEDVVYTIVGELKGNYEQRVICFNHERGTVRTIDNGIEILRIDTIVTLSSQPLSGTYLYNLQKEINTFKPDYIHLHLPNPYVCSLILMCNLKNAQLVVHWHADILGKKFLYRFCKPIENRILTKAYSIITTSREYADGSIPLKKYKHKIKIIPNTVNEQKLYLYEGEESKIEEIRNRYKDKKIVLFIGRHVGYKGIDYLIKSAQYLNKNTVILIGGTGMETENLKRLAADYSDQIYFIGRLPNEEMKYHLYAADVFAFPSIDRREAFGVALAEALYCGLPAVSFYIEGSGTTWVNQAGLTGEVVREQNEQRYAEAINKILDSSDLRNMYSKNARSWVYQHFLKNQIQKLKEIYI